jgi:hypothetical protein
MRKILFLFILISTFGFAQDKTPVKRDPYLQPSSPAQPKQVKPEDKIKIIHADESRKTLKNTTGINTLSEMFRLNIRVLFLLQMKSFLYRRKLCKSHRQYKTSKC